MQLEIIVVKEIVCRTFSASVHGLKSHKYLTRFILLEMNSSVFSGSYFQLESFKLPWNISVTIIPFRIFTIIVIFVALENVKWHHHW